MNSQKNEISKNMKSQKQLNLKKEMKTKTFQNSKI